MIFNAYRSYPYTADYYAYTQITSADGTVVENRYNTVPQQVKMSISTSYIGDLIIITNSKLQIEGKISNVKDRNGNFIYLNGIWEISQTQPRTNPLGFVEGYKYKAKLISGAV